jgi:hypothetical protein
MIILKGIKDRIDVKVTAEIDSDCGATVRVPFVVTYKKPTKDEAIELVERLNNKYDESGELVREKITDEELAQEYILDWRELPDANGEKIPFTNENLLLLVDAREYNAALTSGLQQVIFGRKAVLAKN